MSRNVKTRNKKTLIAILLLLAAFAIIVGSIFALFSDYVTGSVTGTAGTLDLTKNDTSTNDTTTIKVNDVALTSGTTTIPNLNPGDIIEVSYTVRNVGNKSAWLRDSATLTVGTNHKNDQITSAEAVAAFEIYPSTATNTDIRLGSTSTSMGTGGGTADPLTPSTQYNGSNYGFEYIPTSTSTIISGGSGSNDEIDGTSSSKTVSFKLYFKSDAGNLYQGLKDISFSIRTDAVQYRNNTNASVIDWTKATTLTSEFTIGS